MSQLSRPSYDDETTHYYSLQSRNTFGSKSQSQKLCSKSKFCKSPFRIDLVAENERIDEENKVRLRDKARQKKAIERRKVEAKNSIILRALEEANVLDDLRKEKRIILEEERRIKALIDIEKTNATRKQDRIIAERAERKRKFEKKARRRAQVMERLEQNQKVAIHLLKVKHGIGNQLDNTFSSL